MVTQHVKVTRDIVQRMMVSDPKNDAVGPTLMKCHRLQVWHRDRSGTGTGYLFLPHFDQ